MMGMDRGYARWVYIEHTRHRDTQGSYKDSYRVQGSEKHGCRAGISMISMWFRNTQMSSWSCKDRYGVRKHTGFMQE